MDNPKFMENNISGIKRQVMRIVEYSKNIKLKNIKFDKIKLDKSKLDRIKLKENIKGSKPNKSKLKENKIDIRKLDRTKIKEDIKESKIDIKYFENINLQNIHIRIALIGFMIISIIALSVTGYKAHQIKLIAFDVYLGDNKIGVVRQQGDVLPIIDDLKTELTNTYQMDISLKKDIKFEQTKAKDDLLTSAADLKKNIKSKMSFLVYGYVLKVDGVGIGALKTKEEFEDIINRIKEPYIEMLSEEENIKEIAILENAEIVKEEMPIYRIGKVEDIYNHLITSSEEIKTHTVEVGESLWTIAMIYNLSVDDLIVANPNIKPEKLQIGDEVKLVVPKPVLTVVTTAEVEYIDKIKYETEIQYNDNMYKNEKKVKVEGVNGSAKILANEIKHNGILVEKNILKEEVLENPINEVIVKGTKEVPKTVATGAFSTPTRGRISSRYGMRNGRMHTGLDISASLGTPIKAADGGKVVFVGRKGAYGNMVEIDHGNGYKTRYAHCSKMLVKVGDKVYKGQHIANVGNTGRSTGPHLHFEVLKNGKSQNPSKYLK